MATRPVFYSVDSSACPRIGEIQIEFEWYPGFSIAQKQRSIASLHSNIVSTTNFRNPLEISSKSALPLGVSLSAFNLKLQFRRTPVVRASVETVYQGSKIYVGHERNDHDRYLLGPREARKRAREYEECYKLSGWVIDDFFFGLDSGTQFYDWLYLGALYQQPDLLLQLVQYDCFTDIEFNPKKSLACQARSAALARSEYMIHRSLLPYLRGVGASNLRSRSVKLEAGKGVASSSSELDIQLMLEL